VYNTPGLFFTAWNNREQPLKHLAMVLALLLAVGTADASPFHILHSKIFHSKKFWIAVGAAGAVAAVIVATRGKSSQSGSVRVVPVPAVRR
jgi:hypothetical protein